MAHEKGTDNNDPCSQVESTDEKEFQVKEKKEEQTAEDKLMGVGRELLKNIISNNNNVSTMFAHLLTLVENLTNKVCLLTEKVDEITKEMADTKNKQESEQKKNVLSLKEIKDDINEDVDKIWKEINHQNDRIDILECEKNDNRIYKCRCGYKTGDDYCYHCSDHPDRVSLRDTCLQLEEKCNDVRSDMVKKIDDDIKYVQEDVSTNQAKIESLEGHTESLEEVSKETEKRIKEFEDMIEHLPGGPIYSVAEQHFYDNTKEVP